MVGGLGERAKNVCKRAASTDTHTAAHRASNMHFLWSYAPFPLIPTLSRVFSTHALKLADRISFLFKPPPSTTTSTLNTQPPTFTTSQECFVKELHCLPRPDTPTHCQVGSHKLRPVLGSGAKVQWCRNALCNDIYLIWAKTLSGMVVLFL